MLSGAAGSGIPAAKSALPQAFRGAIGGVGPVAIDTGIALAVAAVNDVPRVVSQGFSDLMRAIRGPYGINVPLP
jgi:hypothetical protein